MITDIIQQVEEEYKEMQKMPVLKKNMHPKRQVAEPYVEKTKPSQAAMRSKSRQGRVSNASVHSKRSEQTEVIPPYAQNSIAPRQGFKVSSLLSEQGAKQNRGMLFGQRKRSDIVTENGAGNVSFEPKNVSPPPR